VSTWATCLGFSKAVVNNGKSVNYTAVGHISVLDQDYQEVKRKGFVVRAGHILRFTGFRVLPKQTIVVQVKGGPRDSHRVPAHCGHGTGS
jgi:hypothetical protein